MTSERIGKFRQYYNLTWSVKSFGPILEYSIAYKSCVSGINNFQLHPFSFVNIISQTDTQILQSEYRWKNEHFKPHLMRPEGNGNLWSPFTTVSSSSSLVSSLSSTRDSNVNKGNGNKNLFYPQFGSFELENLKPNCDHDVRLKSRNKFGWTNDITTFTFRTSNKGENKSVYLTDNYTSTYLLNSLCLLSTRPKRSHLDRHHLF